jgi:hypothetical protein
LINVDHKLSDIKYRIVKQEGESEKDTLQSHNQKQEALQELGSRQFQILLGPQTLVFENKMLNIGFSYKLNPFLFLF